MTVVTGETHRGPAAHRALAARGRAATRSAGTTSLNSGDGPQGWDIRRKAVGSQASGQ
jgi:hypothetical protein